MVDDPQKILGDLARLGARLIIQRAVEEEFDGWLGRARYERRPERERGLKDYEAGTQPRAARNAPAVQKQVCARDALGFALLLARERWLTSDAGTRLRPLTSGTASRLLPTRSN